MVIPPQETSVLAAERIRSASEAISLARAIRPLQKFERIQEGNITVSRIKKEPEEKAPSPPFVTSAAVPINALAPPPETPPTRALDVTGAPKTAPEEIQ